MDVLGSLGRVDAMAQAAEKAAGIPGLTGVLSLLLVVMVGFGMAMIWRGSVKIGTLVENNTAATIENAKTHAEAKEAFRHMSQEFRETQQKIDGVERAVLLCSNGKKE